jgi:antitoxin PrlF
MEATVAERGQITLPKKARDALGLTKGSKLKVEVENGRIILRKDVDDALSRVRGRFKLPPGVTTDDIMRELRGRAPGDPVEP